MKLFDTTSFWKTHRMEIAEKAAGVFDRGRFIGGSVIEHFEKELCMFTGAQHCITCGSGTDALYLALKGLGIGQGDSVITTPFTFIATAESIVRAGAQVVFADVSPFDCTISADAIAKIMNRRKKRDVKAIIAVNIFGKLAEYSTIRGIAKHYNLKIIEDAAQSFGAEQGNRKSCNLGDIGCTSFFPTKPLGGIGDGGAVFTNHPLQAKRIRSIANHGMEKTKYNTVRTGINSRLDVLNAVALRIKLREYRVSMAVRRVVQRNLLQKINETCIETGVRDGLNADAIYTLPILCMDRDRTIKRLNREIPYGIYYERPLSMQPVFESLRHTWGDFPVAESICKRIINLPCHEYLTKEDAEQIIKAVNG